MGNKCMATPSPKKRRRIPIKKYDLEYDKDLQEFPLDNGKTRLDYCPFRCGICLLGILKQDAKCGPCVSHVFHRKCLESWEAHLIAHDSVYKCPTCMTIDLNNCITVDNNTKEV